MPALAVFGFGAGVGGVDQPAVGEAAAEGDFAAGVFGVVGGAVVAFAVAQASGIDAEVVAAVLIDREGGVQTAFFVFKPWV